MRPYHKIITPAVADADGICEAQTPTGAGPLTINGDLAEGGVATLDIPRHVSITAAINQTARTFVVDGTNRFGDFLSESLTGPNAGAVISTKNFKTVTRISIDAAAAMGADITVGTSDSFDMQPYISDHYGMRIAFSVIGATDGSYTWAREFTLEDILAEGSADGDSLSWLKDMDRTDDYAETHDGPLIATRIAVSSFVSGSVGFHVLESMEHI